MSTKSNDNLAYLVISSLALLFLGGYFITDNQVNVAKEEPGTQEIVQESFVSPFTDIEIEAQSALVLDAYQNQVLFEKNVSSQVPLASLTKVMTAVTALKYLEPDTIISIGREALETEGDSGLVLGDLWELDDLISFMLLSSSNDAATAIRVATEKKTGYDFIELMNQTSKEIGLSQSFFLNETGLDETYSLGGAFGSAKDMAALISYAREEYPGELAITTKNSQSFNTLSGTNIGENTNPNAEKTIGLRASKTGYTDLAGGNLVVSFDVGPGKSMVAVVLGSSFDGRFDDIEKLIKASVEYINSENI